MRLRHSGKKPDVAAQGAAKRVNPSTSDVHKKIYILKQNCI